MFFSNEDFVADLVKFFSDNIIILIEKFILFVVILIVGKIAKKLINKAVKKLLFSNKSISERKATTIVSILKSFVKYLVDFIVLFTILTEIFGVSAASLIAVFSVFSVAIGLGAQNFFKDIVTGFFFIFEDQFGVSDYVSLDARTGVVENMGLRTTSLRSEDGSLYIIPNSSISVVTNMNKGFLRAILDVSVSYSNDVDTVINILKDEMNKQYESLKGLKTKPEVLGITKMGGGNFELRIVADCDTDKKAEIERKLRIAIKERFQKENIE